MNGKTFAFTVNIFGAVKFMRRCSGHNKTEAGREGEEGRRGGVLEGGAGC